MTYTTLTISLTKAEKEEVLIKACEENLTASAYVRKQLGLSFDKGRIKYKNWMKKQWERKELYKGRS